MWVNSVLRTEYKYYMGSEIWLNTNTNTIPVHKFFRIQIQILFGMPLLYEYEYKHLNYSNNTKCEYEWYRMWIWKKYIKKQQIPKHKTVKIAYWVFGAYNYKKKSTWSEILTLQFPKCNQTLIPIIFGFGKLCKYGYEYNWFWKVINEYKY